MLNSEQQKAVNHIDWPLLILAWAWAGKTHTLTERVKYMVKEKGIDPNAILCVTFTNKAAKEMKERVAKSLDFDIEKTGFYKYWNFPIIGTFHSIWVYFLRLFIDKIGYEKNFTILDEDDKLKIIKEICDEKWINPKEINPRSITYSISQAKNLWINAKSYSYSTKSYFEEKVNEVYVVYEKRLKEMNTLDFDDILIKTYEILENPEVLAYFHNRFKYFLVDEYQDTNEMQYKTVSKLASASQNICVVWDDWQGIYSWRWANIENIFNFQKDYKNCLVIKLEQNYRSTQNIISAANFVIKNNTKALEKTLWTANEIGTKISIFETMDEKLEAEKVAEEIRNILDEKNWKVAILYRTNSQSRAIEEALLMKWISYRIYGGLKFYERKEIKDILAYLRIIANPWDLMPLKRIINVPSRKIWAKSAEVLFEYARNYAITPFEVMENISEIWELTPQARKWIASFYSIYKTLCELQKNSSVSELIKHIVEKINYEEYLLEEYWSEESETKKENLLEFQNVASKYAGLDNSEALNLFLEEIALITDMDTDKNSEDIHVMLMTIHSSKWLEFDNVFVIWVEEWLFPHSRTLQNTKELEEERRLMYVAMTRAKKQLFITRANERFVFGSYSANPPSRFLREIPEEFVEKKQFFRNYNNLFWGSFGSYNSGGTSSVSFAEKNEIPKASKRVILNNNVWDFSLWDKVKHVKFWIGTIVSLNWDNAEIAFSWWNWIKKFNIKLTPMEKVGC